MESGSAYNVYDFSGTAVQPARAIGGSSAVPPEDPTGADITVTVTLKADTGYWMQSRAVTIPGTGAKAYHAITAACDAAGSPISIPQRTAICAPSPQRRHAGGV